MRLNAFKRTELVGTNIKVLAQRPGVVATHFHEQRVRHPFLFMVIGYGVLSKMGRYSTYVVS